MTFIQLVKALKEKYANGYWACGNWIDELTRQSQDDTKNYRHHSVSPFLRAIRSQLIIAVSHVRRVALLKVRHMFHSTDLDLLGILVLVNHVGLQVSKVRDPNPYTDVEVGVPFEAL